MTSYAFTMPAEFAGPGSSLLEGHLAIEFHHQRPEADTNTYEGVAVESVRIVVGGQSLNFNGDAEASDIVQACWDHLRDEQERIECERADMQRDERGAQ